MKFKTVINLRRLLTKKSHLLVVVVLVLVAGAGYIGWKKTRPMLSAPEATRYVSLSGGYLFAIPDKYTADGTAVPGATIVYPSGTFAPSGKSLNDLYASGGVAIQPISELKDNNPDAFSAYVNDVIAADLRKTFKGPTDTRPAKQKGAVANEVYVLDPDGKRLEAVYAIAFTRPVIVVARDRSDVFQAVGSSMEDYAKSSIKPAVDQAAQATKQIVQKLKDQKVTELRKISTAGFKKQKSEEQLTTLVKESSTHLFRPVIIVGGLYNNEYFIAHLVFESSKESEQPAAGVVSLRKKGKTWKLDGLQLPKS